jgi:hypothetical protein
MGIGVGAMPSPGTSAGLASRVSPLHGLRAAAARDIASIGGGTDGVKSITGHVSDKLARQ